MICPFQLLEMKIQKYICQSVETVTFIEINANSNYVHSEMTLRRVPTYQLPDSETDIYYNEILKNRHC